MYGKLLRDEVQEKAVRGYSLKSSSHDHMIKRHFDMRLVFHRPNKCTESQYVFSSEVQPGPIIEGCLKLDQVQEREEEKELAMKWCRRCLMSWVAVVYYKRHSMCLMWHWSWDVPFSRPSPSPRFQLSPPICLKRKSMYMFQVSCIIFSHG